MYSKYSRYFSFTSISYVQENYKLNKMKSIVDKTVFLYQWFSFDLQYYLILSNTNNVQHSPVKKYIFVHSVGSSTSKKSLAVT